MNSAAGKPTTGNGSAMNSVMSSSNLCNGWLETGQIHRRAKHPMIKDFMDASYHAGHTYDKDK
jgi:hypothetical protein